MYKQIILLLLMVFILSGCHSSQSTSIQNNDIKGEIIANDQNQTKSNEEAKTQYIEETKVDLGNQRYVNLKIINAKILEISFEGLNLDDYLLIGNPDDDDKLYLLKKDHSEIKKISENRFNGVADLNTKMYLYKYNNTYYKMLKNYSPMLVKLLNDKEMDDYLVHNDRIYYLRDNKIYTIDNSYSEELLTILDDRHISNLKAYGNSIYFIQEDYLYQFNLQTKVLRRITSIEKNVVDFDFYKDQIIFVDKYYDSSKIWTINLNNNINHFFGQEEKIDSIKTIDDSIYIWGKSSIKLLNWDKTITGEAPPLNYAGTLFFNKDKIYYETNNHLISISYDLHDTKIVWGLGNTKDSSISITNNKTVYIDPDRSFITVKSDTYDSSANVQATSLFNYKNSTYYINAMDNHLYSLNDRNEERKLVSDKNILDFYIADGMLYYIDMENNYGLFSMELGTHKSSKLLPGPISNLYVDEAYIYYSNLADNNSLYRLSKSNFVRQKIINNPTGKIITLNNKLFYFNLLEPNTLYIRNDNGEELKKVDGISNFHRYKDSIYYIRNNGVGILYSLDPNTLEEKFITFMDGQYCSTIDFYIYNSQIYKLYVCEGGSYGISNEELNRRNLQPYEIENSNDNYTYYFKKIWVNGGYLYRLNEENGNIILLTNQYAFKYMIRRDWVYYVPAYESAIYRVDKNGENLERIIYGKMYDPYHAMIDGEGEYLYIIKYDEGLVRINLKTKEEEKLIDDASDLYYISNGYIGYMDADGYFKVYVNGEIEQPLNQQIEMIGFDAPWFYYRINDNKNKDTYNLYKIKYDGSQNQTLINNVINDYSYTVELENWGEVQFISMLDKDEHNLRKVKFALADKENNIIYNLSEFYGNMWVFSDVDSIDFSDLNNDGTKDIVIIANYIKGHGNNAAVEFPVVGVYFQKGKEFVVNTELNEVLNTETQNINMGSVLKRIQEMDLSKYE